MLEFEENKRGAEPMERAHQTLGKGRREEHHATDRREGERSTRRHVAFVVESSRG